MTSDHLEQILFPPLLPYASGMLRVDDIHTLYWEESGNPTGIPVVFIHGGPGGGTSPNCRRFFNSEDYRIILFDQRGAGKSTPMGETINNTTDHLIEDMEKLRLFLGIEKWHLFGGSWGSTLAIAYAEAHPSHCLGLVLRGIFLCRPKEIHWFYQQAGIIFPEAFHAFQSFIPREEQQDLVKAYHKRLHGKDQEVIKAAAQKWSWYEGMCSTLLPNEKLVQSFVADETAIPVARIETHYFMNHSFLPPEGLLAYIDKIRHIPTMIIQGRYDVVCPIQSADELSRAFPEAEYIIVPNAGHSAFDPALTQVLIESTEKMKNLNK